MLKNKWRPSIFKEEYKNFSLFLDYNLCEYTVSHHLTFYVNSELLTTFFAWHSNGYFRIQ